MQTTRLSSKGQIIIPLAIRNTHHWKAGLEFAVQEMNDALLLTPIKPFPETKIKEVMGCVKYKGPVKTLKDMEKGIARGARERK